MNYFVLLCVSVPVSLCAVCCLLMCTVFDLRCYVICSGNFALPMLGPSDLLASPAKAEWAWRGRQEG
jgi:hypothetical protein